MNSKLIAAIVMTTVLATGYGTIHAVGQGSYGSDGTSITGEHSVGIGKGTQINGDDAVVVVTAVPSTSAEKNTAIGYRTGVHGGDGATYLGSGYTFLNGIVLGSSTMYGDGSIDIGYGERGHGENAVVIGESSLADPDNSIALGSHAGAIFRGEGGIGYDPSNIAVVKNLEEGNLQLSTELQEKIKTKEVEYEALQDEYKRIQNELFHLFSEREELIKRTLAGNKVEDLAKLNAIKIQWEEKYNLLEKKGTELVTKKAEINQIVGTWRSGQGPISIAAPFPGGDTRQLIGLAAGTEDTDGVNVAQLKSLDLATHRALDRTVRQLRNEARQGNTMTAALAALKPVAYKAKEPTQVLAGVGQYAGHSGYALGVAHYRNERMMVNAGAALSGNQLVYNAGATLRLGKKGTSLAVDRVHLSVESLFEALQEEQTRNQRQRQVIRELELENQQLHQDVEQLKRIVRP